MRRIAFALFVWESAIHFVCGEGAHEGGGNLWNHWFSFCQYE